MSTLSVKQIIGHALVEPQYRQLLFDNPVKALEGSELTKEEKAMLTNLPRENFESLAGELGERISRAGVLISNHGGWGCEEIK